MSQQTIETYLADHHLEALIKESGISEEVIRARGYWTATDPDDLLELGFAKNQRRVPALVIPVRGLNGNIRFHRIRPDEPRRDPKKPERLIKYEQPLSVNTALDIPIPAIPAVKDPSQRLWIVEGEKKGDCLASRDEAVVVLLGVWNWKCNGWMLPDWEGIPVMGREIIIAFDSDAASNYQVRLAEDALARALEGRAGYVG
jgi:putative DNA primase/helicase